MSGLLHTRSGPTNIGSANFGGRIYDYTQKYAPDKLGDEAKENARVWHVYLDEAESYDEDMIQSFRNIIDGLLVFASLFAGVVTTFVAQTSQALQPDNGQIMVSLLFENNQLLRTAGNRTSISFVPTSTLGPGSPTHNTIDVWVNGLFFTSLALSLSTALLTVLAKQWIQAYTTVVTGGAKTRVLIRHFRYKGLVKWKLGDIIESLPLILHSSVALFLVGLALYVSQLSDPICKVISAITALTFLFYFGTSMLPAFNVACPYRIPFMFSLAQLLLFTSRATKYVSLCLWYMLTQRRSRRLRLEKPEMPTKSLKMVERGRVFTENTSDSLFNVADYLASDSLDWLVDQSSNNSVKEVVVEGACGLFNEWSSKIQMKSWRTMIEMGPILEYNNLIPWAAVYSLSQLPYMSTITKDNIDKSTCSRLIGHLMETYSSKSLLDGKITISKDWDTNIEDALCDTYEVAIKQKYHILSRRLLDWGHPALDVSQLRSFFTTCARYGDAENIRDLVDLRQSHDSSIEDELYRLCLDLAVIFGNLHTVIGLVEQVPALLSIKRGSWFNRLLSDIISPGEWTTLDLAVYYGHPDMLEYLLKHGAKPQPYTLHIAAESFQIDDSTTHRVVELLLDHGSDRTTKDDKGKTPIDVARDLDHNTIIEHLDHYQTVRTNPTRGET